MLACAGDVVSPAAILLLTTVRATSGKSVARAISVAVCGRNCSSAFRRDDPDDRPILPRNLTQLIDDHHPGLRYPGFALPPAPSRLWAKTVPVVASSGKTSAQVPNCTPKPFTSTIVG